MLTMRLVTWNSYRSLILKQLCYLLPAIHIRALWVPLTHTGALLLAVIHGPPNSYRSLVATFNPYRDLQIHIGASAAMWLHTFISRYSAAIWRELWLWWLILISCLIWFLESRAQWPSTKRLWSLVLVSSLPASSLHFSQFFYQYWY